MAEVNALGGVMGGVMEKFASRPKREFDGLVKRYHKQAYNIAYRLTGNHADAEDLTQEAFVRAFRFFDNYRRDLPFENWLYRIISNLFVDDLRRKPKARIHSLDAPVNGDANSESNAFFEIPDTRDNPERVVLHEELDERIQKALSSLPADFRTTVILADIESLSYEEISEKNGLLSGKPCAPDCIAGGNCSARNLPDLAFGRNW